MAFDANFILRLPADADRGEVANRLQDLRRRVIEIPGVTVSELFEGAGDDPLWEGDPVRGRIRKDASRMIMFPASGSEPPTFKQVGPFLTPGFIQPRFVEADYIIGFSADVAPGCEEAILSVGYLPPEKLPALGPEWAEVMALAPPGWWGNHLVRTEMALDPACGGLENFLGAHLATVGIIDRAIALDLTDDYNDQGDYGWDRDIKQVIDRITQARGLRRQMAAWVDDLLTRLGDDPSGDGPTISRLGGPDLDGLDGDPAPGPRRRAQERLLELISTLDKTPWPEDE